MRISKYYLPLHKEASDNLQIASYKYCLRAGLIKQCSAGIYSWLPMGLRVLQNISLIVREEMNKAGCLEMLMPCIQPAKLWQESGRYDDYGQEMLRIADRNGAEMLFGPTNEEIITDIIRKTITSYKQLPLKLYHIQWKFRDEMRPRFGLMRGREFLMKDAYSFDVDEKAALITYDLMYLTYMRIFKRLGLKVMAAKAETGPIGGNLSHEFHLITPEGGESTLSFSQSIEGILDELYQVLDDNTKVEKALQLINKLKAAEIIADPASSDFPDIVNVKAIEIGHIFYLGTKYSSAMKAQFQNHQSELNLFHMGCYGIGISRLVAAIIEAHHDSKGIIWPEAVAPFKLMLINLHQRSKEIAENIYNQFEAQTLLYDDTEESAGVKFARADLIGIPIQVITSDRLNEQGLIEIKERKSDKRYTMDINSFIKTYKV